MALSCLKDEDLESDTVQEAIKNTEGLQILVNLLETNHRKCKIATLLILKNITINPDIAKSITDLGAVPDIIVILDDDLSTLQKLAAEIISNISKFKKPRKIVRKTGGLPKLINLLNVPEHVLKTNKQDLNMKDQEIVDVVCATCTALWAVSQSFKSKIEIYKLNAVKYFGKLLQSCHEQIIIATLGAITQCATLADFQIALQKEGLIEDIVKYLSNENDEIKKYCAIVIFKCAENHVTSNMVRQYGGLDPLVALLTNEKVRKNKILLASVTGAVWKCSSNTENIRRLDELDTVTILIQLLSYENEEVLTNTAGAIAECARLQHNHETILKAEGIPAIVNLLNYTFENLLENVAKILAQCAENADCIRQIVQNDGIRLLWSLLRSSSPRVQASAAWALVPCIQNAKDSAEMIRSFAGGLELLVSLLESNDIGVLSCVCATIAEVARNEENLAVITDLGVVNYLAKLVPTNNEKLREHLSTAIANCCTWKKNCYHFGQLHAVKPLVSYMTSKNINVQRATALALHKLSSDPYNCITLHRNGIVKLLLQAIASKDERLQESSAKCLSNIRNLALKLSSTDHF
ncbi:armadillo repeat-containing protein gudu isoform X2 [Planococcus citri]